MPQRWSQRTYDGLAPAYASANPTTRAGLIPFADRLLAHAGRGLVLDVGCGSGRDLHLLEGRGDTVGGVDQSTGMLARSRNWGVRTPGAG